MISIRAVGLGKAYRVYKQPIDGLKELFFRKEYSETFWALRDVTFEVMRGSSLGIVGDNGAGKSTLLRVLAGALAPTVGDVERVGRVSAILTLGAGFHPELSGLENIRVGCAVLGLSPADTETLLPEIVEFSELGTFVERPVRTYSSGMYLRLGFSVATAIRPEILVVDEHLSVGDQHFRLKCMRRIMALREAGCTLVFCSHDPHAVEEVCERALWMKDGHPEMLAATPSVLKAYQDHVRARDAETVSIRQQAAAEPVHDAHNFLRRIELRGGTDGRFESGQLLELQISARISDDAKRDGAYVAVIIMRNDAVWCYGATTEGSPALRPAGDGDYTATLVMDALPLLSGQFSFTVALLDGKSPHTYDFRVGAAPFTVRHSTREVGVARFPYRWAS